MGSEASDESQSDRDSRAEIASGVRSFLSTLFVVDSAALAFFLVARPGARLPATLPFTLGPELPFKAELICISICLAIMVCMRALPMFPDRARRVATIERWIALGLLLVSMIAVALGGLRVTNDPRLIGG